MTDFILNYAGNWLWSMVTWFFHSIGWGGIAVFVAGCLAVISLSANTMKFLSKPKGLITSAAVLIAGAGYAWWMWPVPAASVPGPSPSIGSLAGTVSQPDAILAKREAVLKPTLAPAKKPFITGVRTVKPVADPGLWIPPYQPPAIVNMPMPTATIVPLSPFHGGGGLSYGTQHHGTSAGTSHTSVSHNNGSTAVRAVGSSPRASQPSLTGKPGTIAPTSGQGSRQSPRPPIRPLVRTNPGLRPSMPSMPNNLTPVQQRRLNNHQRNMQAEREMNNWMARGGGGGGFGGMPHMGGMSHGGGMPHHGGHH